MATGNQRTGFRHAIRGSQLDAPGLGGLIQRTIQRAATDNHLQATKVVALSAWRGQHHLQNGRHAMGEGDLFIFNQPAEQIWLITTGIDLLDPQHGGHIWDTPGMHMEHWGDRHIHIVGAEQADAVQATQHAGFGHGVQHQLAVAEVHTFGVASGAGGVEGGGDRVLVKIREVVARAGGGQQVFVFTDQAAQVGVFLSRICKQNGLLNRGQLALDTFVQRHELAVDQHEFIVGMVHGVENLIRRQADVDGVQHGTDHRNGEHTLQVTVAVPVHHGHGVTGLDSRLGEHIGQTRHTLVEGRVAVTQLIAVDDFAGFLVANARQQQPLNQQRRIVSIISGSNQTGLQHGDTYCWFFQWAQSRALAAGSNQPKE